MKGDKDMRLLTDTPAGISEPDRFHHEGYAKTLVGIFGSNPPGICVGLFGKWGQGKSTVVNLLEKALPKDTTLVVFNAWKSRGDSVRRQMLLAIMERICPSEEVRDFKRFADIYVIQDLIRKAVDKKVIESEARRSVLCDLWRDKTLLWPLWGAILALLLSIMFVVLAFRDTDHKDCWLQLGTAFFLPAFTGVAVYLVSRIRERYSVLVGNIEQISESQKIRYPEQFKDVFVEKVAGYLSAKNVQRLVVVVDDLDRCDPGTVIEALAAVRQFSDPALISQKAKDLSKGCQFLIPCDEHQILLALESDGYRAREQNGQYHDYHREELLRKFFDIVVRMDSFLERELTDYAGEMAGAIGIETVDAQELIDMVEPHDPRQVKKLLNAYKVTLRRIQENQSARLLPADEYMPDGKRTVMMVVALRETVPTVYDLVAKDLSLLDEIRKSDCKLPAVHVETLEDARRIVTRAGKTSSITLEYLVTGRYECELRDIPEGGAFALAVKNGDDTTFAKILDAAAEETKQKLVLWLTHRVRRVATVSRLTAHLSQCVVYSADGSQRRLCVLPVIEACAKRGESFRKSIDSFRHLDKLSHLVSGLTVGARENVIGAVLDNFMSEPASHDAELRFLLANVQTMSEEQRDGLRAWILKSVRESDQTKLQQVVERIVICLPQDATGCRGLAPEAGVHLAGGSWLDEKSDTTRTPDQWPKANLVPLLIGDDHSAAKAALDRLFASAAPLGNAVAINETSVGIRPPWKAVASLTDILATSDLQNVFPHYQKWLSVQKTVYGVYVVIDALKRQLWLLDDASLAGLAKSCADWLWKNPRETGLCKYFAGEPADGVIPEKQTNARRIFFQQYLSNLRGQPGLSQEHKDVLACVSNMRWSVNSEADTLLAEKIAQIPNGTQNLAQWAESLAPLIGPDSEKTKTAILHELKARKQYVREAMIAGSLTVWAEEMDEECARAIANICCEQDNQVLNWRQDLDVAVRSKKGARVVEILVGLLVPDPRLLRGRAQLMSFVASWINMTPNAIQMEWQRSLKPLLLSASETDILSGLDHIQKCTVLDSGVSDELAGFAKHKNPKIVEKSADLLSRTSGGP